MRLHIIHHPDAETVEHQRKVEDRLDYLNRMIKQMSLDTSKALASVRQLTTDNSSLRGLLGEIKTSLEDVKAQLAAAIAAGDPAAIAQAQADLDTIATLADTEDAAVKEALTANTTPGAGGAPQV